MASEVVVVRSIGEAPMHAHGLDVTSTVNDYLLDNDMSDQCREDSITS